MAGKIRLLGLVAAIWSVDTQGTGELSTELRPRRQVVGTIDDRKVVCYYANWAVYRKGDAQFTPQNINPYLCTHLIYAFGGLGKDDSIVPFDEYQDIEKGGYGRFAALKTYNKDLKTMIAIGGWNEGSRRFSPLVEDPARRQVFIKSALRFLRQYNFDGLDLDWEYPTLRSGGRPQDKSNYATLIEEMRQAFESESRQTGKERLLISMAVPASLEYAGQGYAIERLNEALDFFNLLTYDYHSAHEPAVNHHSPLYRPDDWSEFDFRKNLNIDTTVKFYLANGASRHKLILGIPTYGRSYTLVNPDAHEISSPTDGPGEAGEGTKEKGYLAYYEICQKVLDEGWDLVTQYPGIMGPYAHKGNQWVGFDDVDIAVEKAFYVAEEELGGVMFWTIDNDDFRGICSKTPYPLIESAKEAMLSVESSVKTKTSVEVSTSEQVRITRLKLTEKELAKISPSSNSSKTLPRRKGVVRPPPPKPSRQDSPRNLGLATSTTPAPPTTPSSGPGFKCRGEGFFGHPTSCKKYYWCLDTPNEGTVAHTFSCPKGLYFNEYTDGCDFLRNVDCAGKDTTETEKTEADKAESNEDDDEESDEEDPKSLKNILQLVRERGGVEGLEEEIEKEEHAKKKEDDRKERISAKTRNRLTQLLKGRQREAGLASKSAQEKLESLSRNQPSDATTKTPTTKSTQSFRSRTLNRKPSNFFRNRGSSRSLSRTPSTSRTPTTTRPTPSRPTRPRFTFRNRSHLFSRTSPAPRTSPTPLPSEEIPTTLDPELSDPQSDDESNTKIQIVGAHLEPEEPEEKPLHLGVFKPKAGVREKLRDTLHNALMEEMANRPKELEQSTISPVSTVTISKNTRIEGDNIGRTRETVRGFATRRREQHLDRISTNKPQDSNRYVTIQRGRATTQDPPTEDKVLLDNDPASDPDHEDHAEHLTNQHSPEIHFRLLNPDLTLTTTDDDLITETDLITESTPALQPFLPTIEGPTAGAFLPTVEGPTAVALLPTMADTTEDETVPTAPVVSPTIPDPVTTGTSPTAARTRTTVARDNTILPDTGATTTPSTSRGRSRSRTRSRTRLRIQSNPSSVSRQEEPAAAVTRDVVSTPVRRRPLRTRSRIRSETVQEEDKPEKSNNVVDEVPRSRHRIAIPRRLVSRPRASTAAPSAPVFRSGSTGSNRRNQRLRIRGRSRTTTVYPEITSEEEEEITDYINEGKTDYPLVATNKVVDVTIEPVVVTPESTLLITEDTVVTNEDAVVTIGNTVIIDEDAVVNSEPTVVTTEQPVVTTLINFINDEEEDYFLDAEEEQEEEYEEYEEKKKPVEVVTLAPQQITTTTEKQIVEVTEEENDEEVSTLRPGNFKPKFGSATRAKLREKLKQQLSKKKEKEETQTTSNPQEPIFDSAFSDFDLTGSRQEVIVPAPVSVSPPQFQRRIGRVLSPSRTRVRSPGGVRRQGLVRRRLRVKRSTDIQEEMLEEKEMTTRLSDRTQENEVEVEVPFQPFLLKSGRKEKQIFKDRYKKEELEKIIASINAAHGGREGKQTKDSSSVRQRTNSKFSRSFNDKQFYNFRGQKSIDLFDKKEEKKQNIQSEVVTLFPQTKQPIQTFVNTLSSTNPLSKPNPTSTTNPYPNNNKKSSRLLLKTGSTFRNKLFLWQQNQKSSFHSRVHPLQPPSIPTTQQDKVQSGAAAGSDSDYISSGDFRPTVSDVLVPTESPAPPPNTTPPNQVSLTTTLPSLREQPRRLDVFNIDENPSIGTLDGDLDAVDEDQEKDEDADIHSGTSHDSQSITEPLSVKGRPDPARGRSKRPVSNKVSFRQRFRGRSRARGRNPPSPRATITRAPPTITRAPTSITRAPVSITRTPEPITRAPELKTRAPEPVTRPTLPPTTDPISITTALVNTPKALAPITRDPAPLVPIGPLEDQSVIPVTLSEDTFNTPVRQQLEPEYEYEYYYDYLDTEEDTTNTEYDLVPLTNKVRILSDGLPHCFDVGVFPHPYSCKKFINCYRNPGQGIQGSIYQCPSYLAFDPVGGRCNWVNEIVCASRS